MLKNMKNVLVVVLIVLLISSMVIGCAQPKTEEDEPISTETKQEEQKQEENEQETASVLDGEKPVLRVLVSNNKTDLNEDPVAIALEELTGYEVVYEMLPKDNPADKLNLLMASGEPYDLVIVPATATYSVPFSNYVSNGAVKELDGLIETYGPNLQKHLSERGLSYTTFDGKIYGVPTVKNAVSAPGVNDGILIRADWLERLGSGEPETIDEFVEILKMFKEEDYDGVGNVVPLTSAGNPFISGITGSFGVPHMFVEVDGELIPDVELEGFKEYLMFMADLYQQGLFDNEFPVNKSATVQEKFTTGKAGLMADFWWAIPGLQGTLSEGNPDSIVSYIPPFAGANGDIGYGGSIGGLDRIAFIPEASENAEHVMNWMNLKLEDDIFREFTLGVEGTHYEMKDGGYSPILPAFADDRNNASKFLTGIDEEMYPLYWEARVRKNDLMFEGYSFLRAQVAYGDYAAGAPYLEGYTDNLGTLKQLRKDYAIKAIVEGNLDGYEDFMAQWYAAGGKEAAEALNEWYSSLN